MDAIRKLGITSKLAVAIGLVVSLAFAGLVWESAYSLNSGLHEMANLGRADTAELLAGNVSGGMRWKKAAAVESAYVNLVGKPGSVISDLVTWDADGKLLTEYHSDKLPSFAIDAGWARAAEATAYQDRDGHSVVVVPVTQGKDNTRVGTLAIAFANERLDGLVSASVTQATGIAIVALLALLVVIVLLTRAMIGRPLSQLSTLTGELAEGDGDLTRRLSITRQDELGQVAGSVNLFVEKLQGVLASVVDSAHRLDESAKHTRGASVESSRLLEEHQQEIEHVATAMNEMSATFSEVARSASDTAAATGQADDEAQRAEVVVRDAVSAIERLAGEVETAAEVIHRLESESEGIGSVLDVIRGIAEQTNLLALNAAIEAARAGEQGRGFAVVADEVRTLASRTQQSTEEIQKMIERLQSGAREAVGVMNTGRAGAQDSVARTSKVSESLQNIVQAVGNIADMNVQIAGAVEEQTSVASGISENISRISELSNAVVDKSQQTTESCNALSGLSDELNGLMTQFKV